VPNLCRNRGLGADLVSGGPGPGVRIADETMRHWITSFQLFEQEFEYGPAGRESQMPVGGLGDFAADVWLSGALA
jgi:hypothetical protein